MAIDESCPNCWAVTGRTNNGTGVVGIAESGYAVYGQSASSAGVVGDTPGGGPAVWGHNRSGKLRGPGVVGQSYGHGGGAAGVRGINTTAPTGGSFVGGIGVDGKGHYGVYGEGSVGVTGYTESGSAGVKGINLSAGSGIGVYGEGHSGVVGRSFYNGTGAAGAGVFHGRVFISGDVEVANGDKLFKIDHPLDSENKYLLHNAVESSERKNVYDGVAQLDEDGTASVDLPEWFEALNGDFRYQLTAVGGAAPNLHVAEEISENHFKIAGGEGGMIVCWQVTGSRKDAWAAANPFVVEEDKPQEERGRYLQPDLYGAPEDQSVIRAPIQGQEEMVRQKMREEPPPQPPQSPQPPGFEPPGAPAMAPGVAAPGFFGRMEEQHRQEIDELKREIEELKRQR